MTAKIYNEQSSQLPGQVSVFRTSGRLHIICVVSREKYKCVPMLCGKKSLPNLSPRSDIQTPFTPMAYPHYTYHVCLVFLCLLMPNMACWVLLGYMEPWKAHQQRAHRRQTAEEEKNSPFLPSATRTLTGSLVSSAFAARSQPPAVSAANIVSFCSSDT